MLRVNGMTREDVEIVEFPYPDEWYDKPEMLQNITTRRAVAAARPQARPRLPAARDRPGERHRGRHLHAEQGLPASPRGDREVQGHRGPLAPSRLDPADGQLPGRHHLHRRDGRRTPRSGGRLHAGDDQGRAVGERRTSTPPPASSTARPSTATSRTPTRASSTWTWSPTCRRRTWCRSRSARTSC